MNCCCLMMHTHDSLLKELKSLASYLWLSASFSVKVRFYAGEDQCYQHLESDNTLTRPLHKLNYYTVYGFVYLTADRKLVEVGRVRFVYRKACMRVVDVWRVRFCNLKAAMGLVDIGRVRFDYPKVCMRLLEVRRVRFEYCKACRELVEFQRVRFDYLTGDMKLVEAR